MQLNCQIDDEIIADLDKHIDRVRYRNRSHLIAIILLDWLEEQKRRKARKIVRKPRKK